MKNCLMAVILAVFLSLGTFFPIMIASSAGHSAASTVTGSNNCSSEPEADTRNGNLVGHWKFDEGAGNTIGDETAYNNDGSFTQGTIGETDIGDAWVDGYESGALFTDGWDDEVDCGNDASLDITDEITIIVWTKANFDLDRAMVSKYSDADPGYMLKWDRQAGMMFTIDAQPNVYTRFANTNTVTDRWYHLAATFKDDSHLYVDGTPSDGSFSGTVPGSIGTSVENLIFGNKTGASNGYNGTFDEIKIYDRALSALEIREDFMKVTRKAGWDLDESSGTGAADSSEYGNGGTTGHDAAGGGDGTNPVWAGGILNGALELDGVEDYMSAADDVSLNFGEDDCFSISTWIKTPDRTGNIVCKRNGDTFYKLRVHNGLLYGEIGSDADGSANTAAAMTSGDSGSVSDNVWHLVGMSVDPEDEEGLKVYIDGVEMAHADPTNIGDLTNTGPVNLGRDGDAGDGYLAGLLDQVEIWAWPLTAKDFIHNYTVITSITPLPPSLSLRIPDKSFLEGTTAQNLYNFTNYFSDMWDDPLDINYTLEPQVQNGNIIAELTEYTITCRVEDRNWTGNESFTVIATNTKGLSTGSNVFTVTVTNTNDEPVWTDTPPAIVMQEDVNFTSAYTLLDYSFDADGDELVFLLFYTDDDLQINVTGTGHINVTPKTENYHGELLLNVSVREAGSSKQGPRVTIPITVSSVNDPPRARLESPGSGTVQDALNVTLSWKWWDTDDELANITFDLYFGIDALPKLYRSDIEELKYTVTDLMDFTTYYWTVLPGDDEDEGVCSSGVWNLTVDSLLNIPKILLKGPADGTVIDVLQVNLSWEIMNNPTGIPLSYKIMMGPAPDNLSSRYITKSTEYVVKDLQPSTDYYWSVIPYTARGDGICLSVPSVWKFSTGDVAVHRMEIQISVTYLAVPVVESKIINFTLTNTGNRPLSVSITPDGNISQFVEVENSVRVPVGESVLVEVTITNPGTIPIGAYTIDLLLVHEAGLPNKVHFDIEFTGKKVDPVDETEEQKDFFVKWGLFIGGGVLILMFLIIVIIIIVVKGHSKKQERIQLEKQRKEEERRRQEDEEKKRFQIEQDALAKDHGRWRRAGVDYSNFDNVDTEGWEKDYLDEVKKDLKEGGVIPDILATSGTFSLEDQKPKGPAFGKSMKVMEEQPKGPAFGQSMKALDEQPKGPAFGRSMTVLEGSDKTAVQPTQKTAPMTTPTTMRPTPFPAQTKTVAAQLPRATTSPSRTVPSQRATVSQAPAHTAATPKMQPVAPSQSPAAPRMQPVAPARAPGPPPVLSARSIPAPNKPKAEDAAKDRTGGLKDGKGKKVEASALDSVLEELELDKW